MWAEYGPARNEGACGQNSINRRLKSLPNPKDTYNSFSHTDSEKYFLQPVRGILIKPVSSRGYLGEDLEIVSLQVFIDSASRSHSWIQNQVCNFQFLSINIMLCVLTW